MEVKPLSDAWSFLNDPFFNIRSANNGLFYTIHLHDVPVENRFPSLYGLNCISPDEWESRNFSFDASDLDDLFPELKAEGAAQ